MPAAFPTLWLNVGEDLIFSVAGDHDSGQVTIAPLIIMANIF